MLDRLEEIRRLGQAASAHQRQIDAGLPHEQTHTQMAVRDRGVSAPRKMSPQAGSGSPENLVVDAQSLELSLDARVVGAYGEMQIACEANRVDFHVQKCRTAALHILHD
ncbi:hypothetical protein XF14_10815 [Burkholderia gladioli]|nr:hypothetical protein XF14_10815 [Burkholderia gladioli]